MQLTRNRILAIALLVLTFLAATAVPAPDARQGEGARLLSLAKSETESGKYADGIRDAKSAAAAFASSGDNRGRGAALNLAGRALLYSGDYEGARRQFNAALSLSTAAHDDEVRAEETCNLGNVDYFVGKYADAAAQYEAALRITNAHGNEPWTAHRRRIILINQATLDQRLGRDQEALATYRQVQSGPDLRPNEQAQLLVNLGVLYRHLGDPIKALAAYDEARALFAREHLVDGELGVLKNRGIVLALDLNQLDAARANFSDALDRATKAANRREILQARLYRGETELRLGLLSAAKEDFTVAFQAARDLKTPEEEWKALYGMARTELRGGDRNGAERELTGAASVFENIREAIRVPTLRSDFFNDKRDVYDALISIEIDRATPEQVFDLVEKIHSRAWRERLGLSGTMSLAAVQRALPADAALLDVWSSSLGAAIVTVTRKDAKVERIAIDEAAIRILSDALSEGPSTTWQAAAASIAAKSLPRAIPAGVNHLIVVNDGPLTLVPFEILPFAGKPLVEQFAISYAPTAAMLLRTFPAQKRFSSPATRELRAFADPQLIASADEVRAIASELGGRSDLYIGANDRKAFLYSDAAPLLHIASHAVADVNAIEQSRISFAGPDYLFLKEAYTLPLNGVELAVLSACETERGRLLRGEGVQSFSRAFLAAGAHSTVTTLWRVPDAPTAAFMRVFYHHLQRGASRAEALRQAKLRFLHNDGALSNPHYWAAFVLTGEGSRAVPTAVRWRSIVFAAAILIAMIVAVILARRYSP
jgi:tetratricopeptide (TPR) repeat protein